MWVVWNGRHIKNHSWDPRSSSQHLVSQRIQDLRSEGEEVFLRV